MFLGLDYNTWWFLLLGAAITGYAALDGFDLGVGATLPFLNKEESRRIALNSIGPIWDGNEVWLVIAGGMLFAGFPLLYATLLSAFYIPFILFLVMLIFRAVAIEFRSKEEMIWWRKMWDWVFAISSIVLSLALGFVLGNVLQGFPIESNLEIMDISKINMFTPFTIFTSITTLSLFMMHGALYLLMKTEGRLYTKLKFIVSNYTKFFIFSSAILTAYTLLYMPHLATKIKEIPLLFLLPILFVFLVYMITQYLAKSKFRIAFVLSNIIIGLMLILVSIELFPNLVFSTINPKYSYNIYNVSSSNKSLEIMLIIAAIATPLVIGYTLFIMYTFRGKTQIDEFSY